MTTTPNMNLDLPTVSGTAAAAGPTSLDLREQFAEAGRSPQARADEARDGAAGEHRPHRLPIETDAAVDSQPSDCPGVVDDVRTRRAGLGCHRRPPGVDADQLVRIGAAQPFDERHQPRDLHVPGRGLEGIHFAMEFLPQQNKVNAGDKLKSQLRADGKHVIVIGGGDTGSDCVGTSNRHGAASVTQFEVMPQPPVEENRPMTWPYWPMKLRTSSSHDESAEKGLLKREFAISTKEFVGENGKVTGVKTVRVEWKDGKMVEVAGTEEIIKADLVLLAMGFVNPVATILEGFGVEKDARGNAKASTEFTGGYATSVDKVFAAGDIRRGQSLVVWAIREGRQAARAVDEFLMGSSDLPR